MRIGMTIDKFILGGGMPGIDKYAYKLWEHLVREGKHEYILFQEKYRESGAFKKFQLDYFPPLREVVGLKVHSVCRHDGEAYGLNGERANGSWVRKFKARAYLFRKDLMRATYLSSRGLDLIHYPTNLERPYRLRNFRTVMTFHDAVPLIMPETLNERIRFEMQSFLQRIHNVDRFIAVSQSTKNDMVRYLNLPEWKIHVVHNGYDDKYGLVKDTGWVKQKYTRGKPYLLFVGTLEPRKNVTTLIKAFHRLKRKDLKLVLAGNAGWDMDNITKLVGDLKLQEAVVFPGYVPEEDLIALYNEADLFVYPSLYEGFGIPLIEAMVCGAPVITSNISSMPEVVGDAGLLVNPLSEEELKKKIETVLGNPSLRERMKDKGLRRAKFFGWKKCARETREIYKSLVQ